MIVVAIIGILAAVAIPKFANLIRKSNDGSTRGSLGTLRSALSIYYGDNEGYYPSAAKADTSTVLTATLIPKYLSAVPNVKTGYHANSNAVRTHEQYTSGHQHDTGAWGYDSIVPADSNWGRVWVFCHHTDARGTSWTTY